MRTLTVVVLLASPALSPALGGCTFLVVQDLQGAACASEADCAAGDACVEGACTPVADAVGPPPPGTRVDAAGGTVLGPDDATLVLPVGALADALQVRIERRSATTLPVGVDDRSLFYAVEPTAALAQPATLVVPLREGAACDPCALWLAPDDDESPWSELPAADAPAGFVGAALPFLGAVVVAGEAAP